MKRKGSSARDQRSQHRQGRPAPHAGKSRPPSGPRPYGRPRPGGASARKGPTTCPMCGEVVTNLASHVRSKHDDATSHPHGQSGPSTAPARPE